MVQSVGTDALLTCLVHAFPPADLHWVHADRGDGRLPTVGSEKYRVQNWTVDEYSILFGLHIFSIAASDYGTYRCRARNDLGDDSAKLVIYGKIVHTKMSIIGLRRRKQADHCFQQWRSHELFPGEQNSGGLGDISPPVGSRGEAGDFTIK